MARKRAVITAGQCAVIPAWPESVQQNSVQRAVSINSRTNSNNSRTNRVLLVITAEQRAVITAGQCAVIKAGHREVITAGKCRVIKQDSVQ